MSIQVLPFPRFLSFSFPPSFSFLQVLTDSVHIRQLIHREKMTPSRHHAFLCSPDLERICIRANRLSLVRDHPTLHIVLEAAISVSCFTLQARHVHARFEFPGTLCPLQSQPVEVLKYVWSVFLGWVEADAPYMKSILECKSWSARVSWD